MNPNSRKIPAMITVAALLAGLQGTALQAHAAPGDLITGIGGNGGRRSNMAQGSFPDGNIGEAMSKVLK